MPDLVFGGKLVSAGLGTVMAMIFIGRVVAVVNRSFSARLFAWAGLKLCAHLKRILRERGIKTIEKTGQKT